MRDLESAVGKQGDVMSSSGCVRRHERVYLWNWRPLFNEANVLLRREDKEAAGKLLFLCMLLSTCCTRLSFLLLPPSTYINFL